MKTVATFLNPEEAKVARGFLSANGIEAIIAGEESLSVMPHLGMGGRAYQLMVAEEDENQVRRLLAEVEAEAEASDDGDAVKPGWTRKKTLLTVAIFASIFLFFIGNSESAELDRAARAIDETHRLGWFTHEFWRW